MCKSVHECRAETHRLMMNEFTSCSHSTCCFDGASMRMTASTNAGTQLDALRSANAGRCRASRCSTSAQVARSGSCVITSKCEPKQRKERKRRGGAQTPGTVGVAPTEHTWGSARSTSASNWLKSLLPYSRTCQPNVASTAQGASRTGQCTTCNAQAYHRHNSLRSLHDATAGW